MKIVSFVSLVVLFLLSSQLLSSQDLPPNDLNSLLRDASYVFNRFEEATTGFDGQIDTWQIPDSSKNVFKGALAAALRSVELEKPRLNSMLDKRQVTSVALFDVYDTLMIVTAELDGEGSNFSNWGNGQTALQLAQLGAKARVLGANVGTALRSQVANQESQLASCGTRPAR